MKVTLSLLAVLGWFVLDVSSAPLAFDKEDTVLVSPSSRDLSQETEPLVFDEEDILPASIELRQNDVGGDGNDADDDDDFQKLFADEAMKRHMIIDQYIIVFHTTRVSNATLAALRLIEEYGEEGTAEILWSYHAAFPGVTMRGVNVDMVLNMFDDADVDYIEPVSEVYCREFWCEKLFLSPLLPGLHRGTFLTDSAFTFTLTNKDVIVRLDAYNFEQRNPPNWGLDRIDELITGRDTDLTGLTEGLNGMYKFDQTGLGVDVFVVDTGIEYQHIDFFGEDRKSRVVCAYDAFQTHHEDVKCCGCVDYVGHGTHMAGIIGGMIYGVAKDVALYSVKTFDESGAGSIGSVLSGLDYIMRETAGNRDTPKVVNMSFGTEAESQALEQAIEIMIDQGLILTASAGNEGGDACNKVPAKYEGVITVGATTAQDMAATYSNSGDCLDFFAPGDRITSAWSSNEAARATISGTSAAAAVTAGVIALVLQKFPDTQPQQMKNALRGHCEVDIVTGEVEENTPNLLINMALLAFEG